MAAAVVGGGAGGLPARKTTWIENGVVKLLAVDRYWAKKTNVEPVPLSGGMILEGSDKSLEALIAETPRALLVTRFWYIRSVNPQNAMATGLTRDGVWLIENGKVVHPVNNFRFNESPVNLLKNLEATSMAEPRPAASSSRSPSRRSAHTTSTSPQRATPFERIESSRRKKWVPGPKSSWPGLRHIRTPALLVGGGSVPRSSRWRLCRVRNGADDQSFRSGIAFLAKIPALSACAA